jgi:hypothetical protein
MLPEQHSREETPTGTLHQRHQRRLLQMQHFQSMVLLSQAQMTEKMMVIEKETEKEKVLMSH